MEKIKRKKKWFSKWWGILLIILTFLFLIFAFWFGTKVIYYYQLLKSGSVISTSVLGRYSIYDSPLDAQNIVVDRQSLESDLKPSKGAENPMMTIVMFSDFNCPYCAIFYQDLKYFVAENSDQVKLIFRHFPLDDNNIALLTACAGEQGRFWEMHDQAFENIGNFNEQSALTLVQKLNLDLNQFQDCYQTKKYEAEINSDLMLGVNSGVQGTPTIFINGERFAGVMNQDVLKQILEVIENEN